MGRRPPPPKENLEFKRKTLCDICNERRSAGKHEECSKIRQANFAIENTNPQRKE